MTNDEKETFLILCGWLRDPFNEGDFYSVDDFRLECECGVFTDYDGHGNPATEVNGRVYYMNKSLVPSDMPTIVLPEGTTHILWYNR